MKLIREEIESVKFITEKLKSGKQNLYIEGIFLQGNIKNRNGRMYPMETLQREVARYNESNITSGRALGELGHPDGPTVNLDRVSHKIVSLKESGSNFIGKAKILRSRVRSYFTINRYSQPKTTALMNRIKDVDFKYSKY